MAVSVFWKITFVVVVIKVGLVFGVTPDDCMEINGTCQATKKDGCSRLFDYDDCIMNYTTLYEERGDAEFGVKFLSPNPARKWLIVSYSRKDETIRVLDRCCGQLEDQTCTLRRERKDEEFYVYSNINEITYRECSIRLNELKKVKFCDEPGVKRPCIEVRSGVAEAKENWDDASLVMKQKKAMGTPCLLFEVPLKYLLGNESDKKWPTRKARNVSYNGTLSTVTVDGNLVDFKETTMVNVTEYWKQNKTPNPDNALCFMYIYFGKASNAYCYTEKDKLPVNEDPSSNSTLNIIFIVLSIVFICFLIVVGLTMVFRRIYPSYGEIRKEIPKNPALRQKQDDVYCKEQLMEEKPLEILISGMERCENLKTEAVSDQEINALIAGKKENGLEVAVPLDDGYHSKTVSMSSDSPQSLNEDLPICSGNVFCSDDVTHRDEKSMNGNAEENNSAPGVYIRKKCTTVDAHLRSISEARDGGFPAPECACVIVVPKEVTEHGFYVPK